MSIISLSVGYIVSFIVSRYIVYICIFKHIKLLLLINIFLEVCATALFSTFEIQRSYNILGLCILYIIYCFYKFSVFALIWEGMNMLHLDLAESITSLPFIINIHILSSCQIQTVLSSIY